jgi:hypothetical protein
MRKTSKADINKSVWKTCSRGHKYRGSRCPYCWKKNLGKDAIITRPQTGQSFYIFSKHSPFGTAADYRKMWQSICMRLMDEEAPVSEISHQEPAFSL